MSESMPPNADPNPAAAQGVAPGTPPNAGPVPPSVNDDKTIAMLTHLSGLIQAILVPLLVWILKKDTSPYLNDQAKEALNFQITLLIYYFAAGVIAGVTSCVHMGLGFLLIPLIYVLQVVGSILAAIAANKGEYYRYPMCLRLVK